MPALTETTLLKMVNKILNIVSHPIINTIVGISSGKPLEVIDALDSVRRSIINVYPWSWLEQEDITITTTSGTRSYAIPETVKEKSIRAVKLLNHLTRGSVTSEEFLNFVKYHDFVRDKELSPETSFPTVGKPLNWSTFQNRIYLDPVPDAASIDPSGDYALLVQSGVNLDLFNSNTGPLVDADTLDIPLDFEDILMFGTLSQILIVDNPTSSELYKQRFERRLGEMIDQYAAESSFAVRLA